MGDPAIVKAIHQVHFDNARELFLEYAASLGFELCFQNFEEELIRLAQEYALPGGCLLLAEVNGEYAGCVGLRKFTAGICEMKRLYVKPDYRGLGIGMKLAKSIIEQGKIMGYQCMRLDTVASMKEAISLYQFLGFQEIEPYRYNPVEGAIFMELVL